MLCYQISSTSKNISKAKQLIEKAKAIRHNRSKVNEDVPAPVRRSSRQRALAEKKKLEDNEVSLYTLQGKQYFDGFMIHLSNKNASCLGNTSCEDSGRYLSSGVVNVSQEGDCQA